ncbi:MAG TPA: magnesium transporter CorA family protein [bacterium]|nr:magnesium transporter CorA family protein [bacterium]
MKEHFRMKDGTVQGGDADGSNITVYTIPDEAEREELLQLLHCDRHVLESGLDPDEISRLEILRDGLFVVWKRPNNTSFAEQFKLEVSSIGLFLQKESLTVILAEGVVPFAEKEFQGVASLPDVMLRILQHTIHHFLGHLKAIKMLTSEIQAKLNASMGNQYLLQMFTLGENLIYYLDALEANAAVLAKLHKDGEKCGFSRSELAVMEDVMIEHHQCCKQAEIYSNVLSGLMDTRASIINNNMNTLLKNLTVISIVFLPLNLVAGIGGMSEFSQWTHGVDWRISYGLVLLAMWIGGWVLWRFLMRNIR